MTEEEWLVSDDPGKMLEHLTKPGQRKARLFACACCYRLGPFLTPAGQRALVMAEWAADGETPAPKLELIPLATDGFGWQPYGVSVEANAAISCACPPLGSACNWQMAWKWAALATRDAPGEWRWQGQLVRDIFGNPFHTETFDPSLLTPTVLPLARGIYADRAFDGLPILADALTDAGCEDAQLLGHLRGPGPHVRGCWALDLVLGKE